MILFIHGTGDDNTKAENWMPWVAKIMRKHGEMVLPLPGVESDEQDQLGVYASNFLMGLAGQSANRSTNTANIPSLRRALAEAKSSSMLPWSKTRDEVGAAVDCPPGQEMNRITELVTNKRHESGASTSGIKIRIGIGALCVLAYYRRATNVRPIRIIGHSRGGSAAVGVHNVLSSYGIHCNTLTLDPCHGLNKATSGAIIAGLFGGITAPIGWYAGDSQVKDYYTKIWAGTLLNIPCVKNVADLPQSFTSRPPIALGDGGSADLYNVPKEMLSKIKHGHMGKMKQLQGKEAEKTATRAAMAPLLQRICDENGHASPAAHLSELFARGTDRSSQDNDDRTLIYGKVIEAVTQGVTPSVRASRVG